MWYVHFTPAFVYGILNESFIIIGGDQINNIFSVYNGMSMIAAAAVANVLCNILLQYPSHQSIEFFRLKEPKLSADQMNTPEIKNAQLFGRMIGLWLGLTIGMTPLFFIDDNEDNRLSRWSKFLEVPIQRDLVANECCDLKENKMEHKGFKSHIVADTRAPVD